MEKDASEFWNLKFDPFSGQPLKFKEDRDYEIMVRTTSIKAIDDLAAQLASEDLPKKIIVKGNRGSGKTTAMRYLYKKMTTPGTKSIFCNIKSSEIDSVEKLRYCVHSEVLLEVKKALESSSDAVRDLGLHGTVCETIRLGNLPLMDERIMLLLEILSDNYEKLFIFLDNIDKSFEEKESLFLEYFSKDRGFYEFLISHGATFLFITLKPFIVDSLKRKEATQHLMEREVEMRQWTSSELDELVENRLKLACKTPNDFQLLDYFDDDARLTLYIRNHFNPRWTMRGAPKAMQKAYELNQDEVSDVVYKPINKDFCDRYPWMMKGTGIPDFKRFDVIHDFVVRDYYDAYTNVKECLQHNEVMAYSLVEAFVLIWDWRKYPDEFTKNILTQCGLIILNRRAENSQDDIYSLESSVNRLLNFLDESFHGDRESITWYLYYLRRSEE